DRQARELRQDGSRAARRVQEGIRSGVEGLGESAGRNQSDRRSIVQERGGRGDGGCEDGVWLVMRLAIAILLVAACSKHADHQCADAVSKGLDNMLAARGSAVPPPIVEAMGKLKGVITNRCVEDKWSAEVLDCYGKAAGMAD